MADAAGFAWPLRPLQVRQTPQRTEVHDPLRRRWVVLTPEEFVRQQLVLHLTLALGVPLQLMAIERGVRVLGRARRFDLVVYGRSGQPRLLAECKHPESRLGPEALHQAAQYNSHVGASWLVVTNGVELWVYRQKFSAPGYQREPQLPPFDDWAH